MKIKQILVAVLFIALLILAVMGWHWTDLANTPFWWTAWVVIAIVSGVLFILLIRWVVDNWRKLK